jgi:hypothetical protein
VILWLLGCGSDGVDGWFVDLHGRLVDETDAPVAGATARFASDEGLEVGATTTDEDGVWHLPVEGTTATGNQLVALFSADGLADLRAVFDVNLRAAEVVRLKPGPGQTWQATERRIPTLRMATEVDSASVRGQVLDATTGEPVPGMPLLLQRGWNAPVGDPAEGDAVTDAEGRFVFTVYPAGWYTVSVAPTEVYDPSRFPAFLSGAGGEARGTVSPHVAVGQLRASIVWGPAPFDLDLHLSAPLQGDQAGEDGNGQYHVYAGEPTHAAAAGGAEEAAMERTSEVGSGPETVAIYEAPGPGEVRLSVVDVDDLADPSSTALAASGVVLQVWNGEDLARYYTITPGEIATWWRPMVIDAPSGIVYQTEEYAVGVDPTNADAF